MPERDSIALHKKEVVRSHCPFSTMSTETELSPDSIVYPPLDDSSEFCGNQLEYFARRGSYPPGFAWLAPYSEQHGLVSIIPPSTASEMYYLLGLHFFRPTRWISPLRNPCDRPHLLNPRDRLSKLIACRARLATRKCIHAKGDIIGGDPLNLYTCQCARGIAKQSLRDARQGGGQWNMRTERHLWMK